MSQIVQVTLPFDTDNKNYSLGDFLDVVFSRYEQQEDMLLAGIIKHSEDTENKKIDTTEFLSSLDT